MAAVPHVQPDPTRSRAVLVGASAYTSLEPLPAVANNLQRLKGLLTDPEVWGLPEAHCQVVTDPRSTDEVLDALHEACEYAEDALLFYYAGHGIITPDAFDLYLTIPRTTLSPIHAAVPYVQAQRLLTSNRRCRSKVVLLDCCYSGLALNTAMGDATRIVDRVSVEDSYVMTATAETQLALAVPGEPLTAFTGELVRVLDRGLPNGADLLEMDSIYWSVREELVAKERPVPQARSRNGGPMIAFARNRSTGSEAPTADTPAMPQERRHPPPLPRRSAPVPHQRPDFGADLRLPPAALSVRIRNLREAGLPEAAKDLLEAAGSSRPAQEVAAIADELCAAGRPADGDTVLRSAAQRSSDEVLELLAVLDELGSDILAGLLVGFAGEEAGSELIDIGTRLPGHRQQALLESAVRCRVGQPPAMISLIGTLWGSDLRPAAEHVVDRMHTWMPAADATALADALRDAGHEEAAFQLYAASFDVVLRRSPAEIVELAAALRGAGRAEQADRLRDAATARCTTAATALEMLNTLRFAGMTDDLEHVSAAIATQLTDAEIALLSDEIRVQDRPDEALRLLRHATPGRPPSSAVAFVAHLRAMGRPIDANRLLAEILGKCTGVRLGELVVAMQIGGLEAQAATVLENLRQDGRLELAGVIAGLLRRRPGPHAEVQLALVFRLLDGMPIDLLLNVCLDLLASNERLAAAALLRAAAANLTVTLNNGIPALSPPDDDSVAAYVDLAALMGNVLPPELLHRLLRVWSSERKHFMDEFATRVARYPIDTFVRFLPVLREGVAGATSRRYGTVWRCLESDTWHVETDSWHLDAALMELALRRSPALQEACAAIVQHCPAPEVDRFLTYVGAQASVRDLQEVASFLNWLNRDDLLTRLLVETQVVQRPSDDGFKSPLGASGIGQAQARTRRYHLACWTATDIARLGLTPGLDVRTDLTVVQSSALFHRPIASQFKWGVQGPGAARTRIQACLLIPDTEELATVFSLGLKGLLAFTDKAIYHLDPKTEKATRLPYEQLPLTTFHSGGGHSVVAEIETGPETRVHLRWFLGGNAVIPGWVERSMLPGRPEQLPRTLLQLLDALTRMRDATRQAAAFPLDEQQPLRQRRPATS